MSRQSRDASLEGNAQAWSSYLICSEKFTLERGSHTTPEAIPPVVSRGGQPQSQSDPKCVTEHGRDPDVVKPNSNSDPNFRLVIREPVSNSTMYIS